MKITLQLADELYDTYAEAARALAPRSVSAEEAMIGILEKFKGVQPQARTIVVTGKAREELEELLGGGQIRDPEDLVSKVEGLVHIEIEGVRLNFTAGQKQELSIYASKNGISVEEAVRRTVKSMQGQFFNYVMR
jgi:hypothetical protein